MVNPAWLRQRAWSSASEKISGTSMAGGCLSQSTAAAKTAKLTATTFGPGFHRPSSFCSMGCRGSSASHAVTSTVNQGHRRRMWEYPGMASPWKCLKNMHGHCYFWEVCKTKTCVFCSMYSWLLREREPLMMSNWTSSAEARLTMDNEWTLGDTFGYILWIFYYDTFRKINCAGWWKTCWNWNEMEWGP